jgi:membrane-associated phospholipid phosphatase
MRILTRYLAAGFLIILSLAPVFASADETASTPTSTVREDMPQQPAMNEAPVEFNKDYIKGYFTDFKNILTSPARWDASDWLAATLVTGVAVGLYENDEKIRTWVQDNKTTTTNDIGDNVTDLGHGKYTPVVIGGMYLYGHFAEDGKARKTALLSVESFVLTGVFVQTLKYATRRHRPNTGDPYHTFDGPSRHSTTANSSFPSGHSSSAFAVATVIASEYDNAVVPALAYSVATIAALNRVMHDAHWSSDTVVGAALGYFTGKAIVASHRGGRDGIVKVSPVIMENGDPGIALVFGF